MNKKGGGLLSGGGSMNSMNNNRLKSINRRYLCMIISFVLLISLSFIFIAWNILCDIDTESSLKLDAASGNNGEIGLNQSSGSEKLTKHTVEIFYEVLCPDSKYFILNQLIPVYKKFNKYIHPVLIPYGKAFTRRTREGKLKFECQHGEIECEGNILHACAIHHISNEQLLISYIHCLMKSNIWNINEFGRLGEQCADEYQISWTTLKACWKGDKGELLLKSHGDLTQALTPSVKFIPTIVVDHSQSYQQDILKDFKSYLCKRILFREKLQICT